MAATSDDGGERRDAEELSRAIRDVAGVAALPPSGVVDLESADDVNRAADALLALFLAEDDGAAFELLTHVAVPLLDRLARQVTRDVGLAVPSVTLVAEHMTSIFLDANTRHLDLLGRGSFVNFARENFTRLAERHLEDLAMAGGIDEARREEVAALIDGDVFLRLVAESQAASRIGDAVAPVVPVVAEPSDCDTARTLFAVAFHRLDQRHRRALLLVEVDGLGKSSVAQQFEVDESRLDELVGEARSALAENVRALMLGGSSPTSATNRGLADLLYELAKAALLTVEDVNRRLHCQRLPRSLPAVSEELRRAARPEQRAIVARIVHRDMERDGRGCRGLTQAKLSVSVLEQVEGSTPRQRLAKGLIFIVDGKPSEAQHLLEAMLAEDHTESIRQSACLNFLWALNRQQKYREAFDWCPAFLAEFPANRMLIYNTSVAAANLRDFNAFVGITARFRALPFESPEVETKWRELIRFEAPRFAEALLWPEQLVEDAFGFRLAGDATAASPNS